jgi:hypothetical protein
MSGVPLALHQYGDLGDGSVDGIANAGGVAFDLGSMVIDNLGSGNFDMIDEPGVSFVPRSPSGIMGKSVLLYHQLTGAVIGACVFGAYEPGVETTLFNEVALPKVCVACTWLLGLQESLFSIADRFGSDWITVWSLNPGNPDTDKSGTSIYYAHPYQVGQGETATSIMTRFGLNVLEISRLNPGRQFYNEGDVVCVMPRWTKAVDRNNLYVCRDREPDQGQYANVTRVAPSPVGAGAVSPQSGVGGGVVLTVQ